MVLQILCRYKWHACRLTCSDKFRNVPTKLWKSIIGGGGELPPAPPPPPGYANGWQCQGSRYVIWPGIARGKFKDLVCLVVFLCWIKRFVLLSLCLKCKYMNRYFSSFQKSRGDDPPQKNSRGDTSPPPPPPSPRDRRLWKRGLGLCTPSPTIIVIFQNASTEGRFLCNYRHVTHIEIEGALNRMGHLYIEQQRGNVLHTGWIL